ncbi:MAG: hypothetical protein ACI8SR_002559 [Oceanicoccus sp.]|jgi:hypothetical protein
MNVTVAVFKGARVLCFLVYCKVAPAICTGSIYPLNLIYCLSHLNGQKKNNHGIATATRRTQNNTQIKA